jgi:general secretion pathway protein L
MHRIVGLDLTESAARIVALESGFRGFTVLDARTVPLTGEGSLGERLKAALAEHGLSFGEDAVAVALPSSQVASHQFTLPFTDPRRIEQVLPAEVEGAIPFETDQVVWDHCTLSTADGKSQVLVAVVQNTALDALLAELRIAGIEPRTVTSAPIALAILEEKKLLAFAPQGSESIEGAAADAVLLLEAGPEQASVTVLHAGSVELARSLSAASLAVWSAAASEEGALEKLLVPLVRDLKLALRSRGMVGPKAPTRALLAGPLATMPGAQEMLAELIGIPAELLALDAATLFPEGAPPASELALAFSLALRAQHPRGHINFRKGSHAFTKDISQTRGQMVRLAIALAVVLVLALASGIAKVVSLSNQAAAYDEALCNATKRVLGNCLTDYRVAISQMSGGASKAGGIPRVSSSEVLAEVLSHLPETAIPLLDDMEVTTTSVRLKGVVDSFAQVSDIQTALKADKCLGEIKQPRTEKQHDGAKIIFSLDFPYLCSGEAASASGS